MQTLVRRSFIKAALVGAATVAISAAAKRSASAAQGIKDVRFAKDPKNLQPGLEAAHIPSVALEKVENGKFVYGKTPPGDFYRVTIQAKHEATKEHHIFDIALYVNGEPVVGDAMSQVQAADSIPAVSFVQRLKEGDELVAVTTCNLHGKWGRRVTL